MINVKEIKEVKEVKIINQDRGIGDNSKLLIMNDGTEWLQNRGEYTARGVKNYYTDAKRLNVIDGKYDMTNAHREEYLYKADALEINAELAKKIF